MGWCIKCENYLFTKQDNDCSCREYKFQIKDYDGEELCDWRTISARTDHHAVERIAQAHFDEDPGDPDWFDIEVLLKLEDEEAQKFKVTAEVAIQFNINEED